MEILEKGGLILKTASSYKRQQLFDVHAQKPQINALSYLQIASADHFAREMDHMAEGVLREALPARRRRAPRDMILMDTIYRAAKDRRSASL
jgi:hypothetical protein